MTSRTKLANQNPIGRCTSIGCSGWFMKRPCRNSFNMGRSSTGRSSKGGARTGSGRGGHGAVQASDEIGHESPGQSAEEDVGREVAARQDAERAGRRGKADSARRRED